MELLSGLLFLANILDLEKEQSLSIKCPDADVSTNEKSQASIPLRVRRLSGDNLSNRKSKFFKSNLYDV